MEQNTWYFKIKCLNDAYTITAVTTIYNMWMEVAYHVRTIC